MKHVISALVMNQPGVLAQVSGMFASRGFNIDSLVVGETERHDLSRMTIVVNGDDKMLDQVRKQLEKIVTVVKVQDYSGLNYVERDLMIIKVDCPPSRRHELLQLVDVYRGRVVDIGTEHLMIELSGREAKIESFIEQLRPYGIRETARTGTIAMPRGIGSSQLEQIEE
jgi:acetolactate synthase-1/3 small subunit